MLREGSGSLKTSLTPMNSFKNVANPSCSNFRGLCATNIRKYNHSSEETVNILSDTFLGNKKAMVVSTIEHATKTVLDFYCSRNSMI